MIKQNNNKKIYKTSNIKKNSKKYKKLQKIKEQKRKQFYMIVLIFLLGTLLIFSAYAWFSTALNVKVKTFNMVVTKNSGLSISFDAINYDSFVEISEETLITNLKNTYPNNLSQWAANGLIPVSSPGITNKNSYYFDMFLSEGIQYRNKKKENGLITTHSTKEERIRSYNNFIAFDLFLKNDTGSPTDDNLYIDDGTGVTMVSEFSEEMSGLVNSVRLGFVKVGSTSLDAPANTIQNLQCNNDCESIIYEPNSNLHTELSKERLKKYNINLVNGEYFPTYAYIKEAGPLQVKDTISGSNNLDENYFKLQNTMTEKDHEKELFSLPNGVTKMRVYVWIEGQDVDSIETNSEGADISISINFIKDTLGYTSYN